MREQSKPRTVAFNFDGVIAGYHGFECLEHTGEPILQTVEAIRHLKSLGCTIIIYSTRDSKLLRDYCNKHAIPVDYINDNQMFPDATGTKPVASVYVDDRALCFSKQSADTLAEEIINFKPYWK